MYEAPTKERDAQFEENRRRDALQAAIAMWGILPMKERARRPIEDVLDDARMIVAFLKSAP